MRLLSLLLLLTFPAFAAEIPAREVEKTYAIHGTTGAELYTSIGEKGPRLSGGRSAIAFTAFELKWHRDYRRDGSACVLVAAKPFLTITTTLPKPSGRLPAATQAKWDAFAAGLRAHERQHGAMIRELAAEIARLTIGFRQENDPGCTKIRKAIEPSLKAASGRHQERSRAFDRDEMGEGGTVARLVIGLVGE